MTEPNVVRTCRQRIELGNPGTWSGPLPVRYSKSNFFFFSKCVAMHRDLYIPRHDRSKMRYDRYYIKTTVFNDPILSSSCALSSASQCVTIDAHRVTIVHKCVAIDT